MGEASRKSRAKAAVLNGEPRCIYCLTPNDGTVPLTLEHMPPIMLFENRQRASGMEFACCDSCNQGTKGADIAASVMSLISQNSISGDWKMAALERIKPALDLFAPGFRDELKFSRNKTTWFWTPNGLIEPKVTIHADGPIVAAYLSAFSAKLAMALYREHVGRALPPEGAVFTVHFLNAGLAVEYAETLLSIMPAFELLKQGRKTSLGQFEYRYNSDDRSILAALVSLHHNLHVLAFATSAPETYAAVMDLPKMTVTKPGDLVPRLKAALPPKASAD